MRDVFTSFGRALGSLRTPGMLWHMVWPALVALALWTVGAIVSWSVLVAAAMEWIAGWPLAGDWVQGSDFAAATALVLVKIALVLAMVPLIYLTAALLVAVFALPMMIERVAREEYGALEQRRGGSNLGSVLNTVWVSALFLVMLVASLPLWLIPGFGLLVSIALTAWLNARSFGYDALMQHADRAELAALPRSRRDGMFLLGGVCALLAHIPFVNLVAPAFSALAFVHFMLAALNDERGRRGVTILDPEPPSSTQGA